MGQRRSEQHNLYRSSIETVATTLLIDDILVDTEYHYMGVRYYSDAAGTPVVPGAGTVVIEALDEATNQWTPTAAALDSTDVLDKEFIQGNIQQLRAVPTGITTATHWQLFCSSNL